MPRSLCLSQRTHSFSTKQRDTEMDDVRKEVGCVETRTGEESIEVEDAGLFKSLSSTCASNDMSGESVNCTSCLRVCVASESEFGPGTAPVGERAEEMMGAACETIACVKSFKRWRSKDISCRATC